MLPSTGYFKGINCPFYDSGLCERPYCHFRHVKKETQSLSSDGIEDGTILQKLVSAAVQKVLQQTETSGTVSPTQVTATDIADVAPASSKVSYNPTPISELNKINSTDSDINEEGSEQHKKHIPIPYTPRKPTSVPIKRNVDTNGSTVFTFIPPAKYSPGSEKVQLDPYTPPGTTESTEKYLPGKETAIPEYTLDETQKSNKRNYVPSDKTSKKKILEYKPMKLTAKSEQPCVTYQPTPKSLVPCFSSDEEDVDNKKRKFSGDLNGLDDLGPEFDILDQILDEEKTDTDKTLVISPTKQNSKGSKENNPNNELGKKDKSKQDKIKTSNEKLLQDKRRSNSSVIKESEKNSKSKDKERKERHSKSSEEKVSLKKSSKDREEKRDKSEKKSHISSKSSHSSSKSSHSSSKSSHESSKSSHENSKVSHSSKRSHENSKSSRESSKSSHENSKGSHESSRNSKEISKSSRVKSKTSKNRNHSSEDRSKHHKSSKEDKKKPKFKGSRGKEPNIFEVVNSSDEDSNRHDDVDSINDLSESDEEAITEECKRIFEEYIPSEKIEDMEESNNKEEDQDDEYYVPAKKRISRTIDKNIKVLPKAPAKPDFKVNAAQAMAERLAKVREYHASKTSNQTNNMILKPDVVKNYFSASANGNSKVRIAHVPYASTLLSAKKIITPGNSNLKSNLPSTSSTITQTIKKGAQRVAHVPNEKFIDRPGVLEPLASKIPANIRSTYLNMMIDHCLKIYLSATDAYARAQHEELTTSKKCSTVPIYKNSAVLTISRLKKEVLECDGIKKSGSECLTLKKMPQVTTNKTSSAGSWSIESKNKKNVDDSQQFLGSKLYKNISKWILTEEQLKENGFPRPHASGERGRAVIHGQNKQKPPKGLIRTCCRCKKDYTVDKKGFAAIKEECIYHPNNKYRVRGEVRYQCCSQDGSSDGCCIASSHVYEYVDFDNLKGFVKTLPSDVVKDDYGVYSLDCEMCYTTHGLDLTRVTVINSDCKVVYETLIKPLHPIIDYNTRYSGITEEQMAQVRTTLLEVQATLLTMFNSKTILIGHSLESDFKALKLIHDTVIDTSVLFPHKMGPPYKRALRNLSSEYLKKIIQNSVDGHDSAEDATVCMELIHYKLKEDLKTR